MAAEFGEIIHDGIKYFSNLEESDFLLLKHDIDVVEFLEVDVTLLQNIDLNKSWKQRQEIFNCTQFLLDAKKTSGHGEHRTPTSVIVLHRLEGSQLPELGTNL